MAAGFPLLENPHRRIIRSPVNEMDKSTIVSIYPKAFLEVKHTLSPGRFAMDAGSKANPSILVVGSSSWWKEFDMDQPLVEIPVSSVLIANSVITDYANGLLDCNMSDKMPGLFWVMGAHTKKQVVEKFQTEIETANIKQRNWYAQLVKTADVMWSRTNGNPLAIDDLMKLAAQELGMKNKPWLADFNTLELRPCPACGTMRNETFPVCVHCKTIVDKDKFEKLGMKVNV